MEINHDDMNYIADMLKSNTMLQSIHIGGEVQLIFTFSLKIHSTVPNRNLNRCRRYELYYGHFENEYNIKVHSSWW